MPITNFHKMRPCMFFFFLIIGCCYKQMVLRLKLVLQLWLQNEADYVSSFCFAIFFCHKLIFC